MAARQNELIAPSLERGEGSDGAEGCALLVDTLRQRLGPHSVRAFEPIASHLPEWAEKLVPITISSSLAMEERREGTNGAAAWPEPDDTTRPLLLLPQAEPTEVMALIPDGPPRRFRWRGITYDVAGAQGPERIGAEWWHLSVPPAPANASARLQALTRDYYLVEDSDGHRFWLYREGLYERETNAARWFVHGLFA